MQAIRLSIQEEREAIFNSSLPFLGSDSPDAVEIAKFSDFRCPFCASAHEQLVEFLEVNPNIRVIIHEFPVLGPESFELSQISLHVFHLGGLEAWREIQSDLFAFAASGDVSGAMQAAEEKVQEVFKFSGQSVIQKASDVIEESLRVSRAIRLNGTPGFVIGDRIFVGIPDSDTLLRIIEEARQ